MFRALRPDGSPVEGFAFDGARVTWTGSEPVEAGIRYELELDGGAGLARAGRLLRREPARGLHADLPALRGRGSTRRGWSRRRGRSGPTAAPRPPSSAATAGSRPASVSPLGQAGVGFAHEDGRTRIWLDFPYREEPIRYDGSETPAPPDVRTHRWRPGESVELDVREVDRSALRPAEPFVDPGRVDVETAAELAAWGLWRWHYLADPPRLVETRSFDGETVRDHMHVSWVSGAPYAYALLRHGRRVGSSDYVAAADAVLDHIDASLTPGGTYWPQWTRDRGWTWGWHPDSDRAHARTLADATLFMLRAGRERSARSNLAVAMRAQRGDGALAAAHSIATGEAVSWEGTAGMAWIPALVEAGELDAAGRAGAYFRRFEHWHGAPEDVDVAPSHEDGIAAVMAAVALEDWEWARRAADWMLTFRYTYDVDFPPDTDLGRHGFRTRGADQASPANQHLHAFALFCLPEMLRLAEATGDAYYRESALENLACFRQVVARHDGDFGARRGMTAERYLQTDVFGPKGTIDPLAHAWTNGVLLLACEELLA